MTARTKSPGTIRIEFDLSGDDAKQIRLMAKDARKPISVLAKSLIRDVIADDRVAHESSPRGEA